MPRKGVTISMKIPGSAIVLCVLAAVYFGCASAPAARVENPSRRDINAGYALFHGLMGDERRVSGILIIKDARKGTEKLIKEIAKTSDSAFKTLNQFAKEDKELRLDRDDLPAMENLTRKAMDSTQTKL